MGVQGDSGDSCSWLAGFFGNPETRGKTVTLSNHADRDRFQIKRVFRWKFLSIFVYTPHPTQFGDVRSSVGELASQSLNPRNYGYAEAKNA
jgi:hypothetical protein